VVAIFGGAVLLLAGIIIGVVLLVVGGDSGNGSGNKQGPSQPLTAFKGFKAIESEGRDEKTGLWKEIEHIKTGIRLRLIPAGEFDMGSPVSDTGNPFLLKEGPLHRVRIAKPFYMSKYEVTQAQYTAIIVDNPCHRKGDNLPVVEVEWNDVQEFFKRAGDGLRLPSEAEWEYACRAGSRGRWCFGDDDKMLTEYAWYTPDDVHEVGQKKPNVWGLYDMHGNVREWCEDVAHEDYKSAPSDGSAWMATGNDPNSTEHIVRGGNVGCDPKYTSSTTRVYFFFREKRDDIGFRVVVAAVTSP
jgi:formylglycine-generating enzyme required for sulfatase activity